MSRPSKKEKRPNERRGKEENDGGIEVKWGFTQIYFRFHFLENEPPRVDFREWRLRPFNYDNTINAMLTLFVVTTGTSSD